MYEEFPKKNQALFLKTYLEEVPKIAMDKVTVEENTVKKTAFSNNPIF